MAIVSESYCRVSDRFEDLGLQPKSGLLILPRGFENATEVDELHHESSSLTIRKLWREKGVGCHLVQQPDRSITAHVEHDSTWVGPTIFISWLLWTENPEAVSLALNIVADYATDFFKGRSLGTSTAKLDVVVEDQNGGCTRLRYKGPVDGIGDLRRGVEQLCKK